MNETAGLMSKGGTRIALKSVHIEGQLEGLLASVTIGQHYRNECEEKLEVVYTFPVAWGAVLVGADIIIGEKYLRAGVVARDEAWERYEEAIHEGDTPILVERSGSGLYTANLGNIEPGETVTLYTRYAQLLRWERGQVRLNIPCAAAPRYGAPHDDILPPPASIAADTLVEYPLTVYIKVLGDLAKATISCPTHSGETKNIEGGVAVSLNSAMLDRDFVLLLRDVAERSFTLLAPDGKDCLALASFCPDIPMDTKPLALKILVDCSCSMAGDSIMQVRQALHTIYDALKEEDFVSFGRFGDYFVEGNGLAPWSEPLTKVLLACSIDTVRANMGGTRLKLGLHETFWRSDVPDPRLSPNVLLISDGEVWNIDETVKESLSRGQPVFTLGVGSAPVESLLRKLARKTGGACELASPNENITDAVTRLLDRMRGDSGIVPRIDWTGKPIWQSALPSRLHAGDTVHAFALLKKKPDRAPVLYWDNNGECRAANMSMPEQNRATTDALVRLGGAKRMAEAKTPQEARKLALKYQVVGEHSALFLAHLRGGEKKAGLPALQRIPQMLAAGFAGFGSVLRSRLKPSESLVDRCWKEYQATSPGISMAGYLAAISPSGTGFRRMLAIRRDEDIDFKQLCEWLRVSPLSEARNDNIDARLTKTVPFTREYKRHFLAMAMAFDRICTGKQNGVELIRYLGAATGDSELRNVLNTISTRENLPIELIYALSLDWLQANFESCRFSEPARRTLRILTDPIPDAVAAGAVTAIAKAFKGISSEMLPKKQE